jgi:hypothetical protein
LIESSAQLIDHLKKADMAKEAERLRLAELASVTGLGPSGDYSLTALGDKA